MSQSGSTLTIVANGTTTTMSAANITELAIYAGNGNNNVTVQSSVNIITLLYCGNGQNNLTAAGSNQNFIVTIGGSGKNVLTGNGINTAFWCHPNDTVNATAKEIANGGIHRVASFYGGVSTTLAGQNLADPTDSGKTVNYSQHSLFGAGPLTTDVNQGAVGDCYFLAAITSFAHSIPGQLMQMAVDLGDGTYAVQFKRGNVTTYVRVDADLPVNANNTLKFNKIKTGGAIWGSIMEKAYAFFRTGADTYASLNSGWTGSVYSDFGVANTSFLTSGAAATVYNTIAKALADGKAVSIITTPTASGPAIASHAYSIFNAFTDSKGTMWVTIKNPWGYDGVKWDDNPNDGLLTITMAQLQANFSMGSISK